MGFRNLQGKILTIEEILKEIKEKKGVSIITRKGWMRWVHKSNTIVEKCLKCSFPVMEYRLEIYNGKTILCLGCPYCFATEKIENNEIIKILLNREEENQKNQPPLFNEVMVQ